MWRLMITSAVAVLIVVTTSAQDDLRLHVLTPDYALRLIEITKIEHDAERLQAFDLWAESFIANPTGSPKNTPEQSTTTEWFVERNLDPLTDDPRVVFFNTAIEGYNSYGKAPVLLIRQRGASLDVWVSFDDYFSEDDRAVSVRFDANPMRSEQWLLSTDNTALFSPSRPTKLSSVHIIDEMLGAERFVIRATPYNETPITAVFDISGLKDAARPFADDLPNWNLQGVLDE